MDPFIGEIRAVGFPFAPKDWAICDGSLLPIRSFSGLFSLLGTTYGGDGRVTFALPDLRGRAVVNAGAGPGLSPYSPGQTAGTESVALTLPQMPAHTHTLAGGLKINPVDPNSSSPAGHYLSNTTEVQYGETAGPNTMAAGSIRGTAAPLGGAQPHENRQPFLAINYVIALQGEYPQRP